MALKIYCYTCKKELNEPGALIISSPQENNRHRKLHLCIDCEKFITELLVSMSLQGMGWKKVDEDGDCYYCGKITNSLAANPSEWPVMLCHSDNPGKVKYHHTGCVSNRLHELDELKKTIGGKNE